MENLAMPSDGEPQMASSLNTMLFVVGGPALFEATVCMNGLGSRCGREGRSRG